MRLSLLAVLCAVFAPSLLMAAAPPVDARIERAKTLYDGGQYDEAIAQSREVLADSPEDPTATAELMRALYAKGESKKVVKVGEAFVGKTADVPAEAYVALGGAYEALKDLEKGGVMYREGTLKHPTYANLHLRFGVNRMQVRSLDEARLAFVESLKLEPRNSNAWLYLGRTCQELRLPRCGFLAYAHFLVLEPATPRSSRPAQVFTALVGTVNATQVA